MRTINKARYYTAREARERLGGIHSNTLKHYVDSGKLKREIPPGRKQGVYAKKQVDDLAKELEQFYEMAPDSSKEDEHGRIANSA